MALGVVPQSSWSFKAHRTRIHLLAQRIQIGRIALAHESRGSSERLQRPRACGGCSRAPGVQVVAFVPVAGPGAAACHRGDTTGERFVDLLWADEMNMRIEAASGYNMPFGRDHFGACTDDHAFGNAP